jgi:hypothetical protein
MGDLAVLRSAVDLYQTEHGGTYPGQGTSNPELQLTQYTDDTGAVSPTKGGNFIYGPYVRSLPTLPVGAQKGKTAILSGTSASKPAVGTAGYGWCYETDSGKVYSNTANGELDERGTAFNLY